MTYNVFSGTLNPAQSICMGAHRKVQGEGDAPVHP